MATQQHFKDLTGAMAQRYTTDNGVRRQNPAYVPAAASASSAPVAAAVPFANQATALAVVPVPTAPALEEEIVVVPTEGYGAAVARYEAEVEPEIYVGGYQGDGSSIDALNAVLAKYEVPAGMLSKILDVSRFETIEIIVDDSGSMGRATDARDPVTGASMSRWAEARHRISQMVELLAHVKCPPVRILFLNRATVIVLRRGAGELPAAYIERAEGMIGEAFGPRPSGTTPALDAIRESLGRHARRATLRYFLGDGVPNGGKPAVDAIQEMISTRADPERNPFTFLSCTDQDDQVEWMKDCEERAPYCAELDDYDDESREVLGDQGDAFPYSYGMHLVCQIAAAYCPDDLDALDESVPLTRAVLEGLLGYATSREEYDYYFDRFVAAQSRKRGRRPFEVRFAERLPRMRGKFEAAAVSADIEEVRRYREEMRRAGSLPSGGYGATSRGVAPSDQDDCCVVL